MGRDRTGNERARLSRLVLALAALSWIATCGAATADTEIRLSRSDRTASISVDGTPRATLVDDGASRTLTADEVNARVVRSETPSSPEKDYPRHVVLRGEVEGLPDVVREEYDVLAPPAPIDIEGLGLVLEGEDPDINREEHAQLRAWLADQGLPADTTPFEALHRERVGRDLRVWYEIAGRRVEGRIGMEGEARPSARFDTGFHVTEDGWKIHHARSPFYHRTSLELVDTITAAEPAGEIELRSYHCGCYGWAIGGDWVTVGDDRLYHALVEWRHHRVGAGLFVGVQPRPSFPWFGFADRDRVSRLARRAAAYRLTDAAGTPFAEIEIELDPDPPPGEPGPQSYTVRLPDSEGQLVPVAEIDADSSAIGIRLIGDDSTAPLDRIDVLLAALPTQVLRGDGMRDSHLGRVETLVDWVRLLGAPNAETLADVVSEIDALTAVGKVRRWLDSQGDRFDITKSEERLLPPEPRLPESAP